MHKLLSPALAANAANIVYDYKPLANFDGKLMLDELARDPFRQGGFDNNGRVQADVFGATSGNRSLALSSNLAGMLTFGTPILGKQAFGSGLHKRTGYAIAVKGNENGDFRNHLLIAIRGTSGAADILSDINCSLAGRFGVGLVHGGFSDIFETLSHDIDKNERLFAGVEAVHIVGHSLGGALATLLTADLLRKGKKNLHCYTFGAPRVGNHAFGEWLSAEIGNGRYKRVYHPGDPVPMAPVFPFFHAPFDSGIKLSVPQGTIVFHTHHSMEDSYLPLVAGYTDWAALQAGQNLKPNWRIETDAWLNGERTVFDIGTSSAFLLFQITKAIIYIIERMAIVGLSTIFTASSTILDHLAEAMYYFGNKAVQFGKWVTKLIYGILRYLGLEIIEGVSLTLAFLRYVFDRFKTAMSTAWRKALTVVDMI